MSETNFIAGPGSLGQTLACEITLGPLVIKTEANLDQVAELILRLVKEYRELPPRA